MENCSNNFFLIFPKIVTNRGALFIETYFSYLTYLMFKILNISQSYVVTYHNMLSGTSTITRYKNAHETTVENVKKLWQNQKKYLV